MEQFTMLSHFQIESYGLSDIGISRSNNEDAWAELPEYGFYVLADGIGGHKAGEIAAKEATLQLCDLVDAFFQTSPMPSLEEVCEKMSQHLINTNQWLRKLSRTYHELEGMGTTICILWFLEKKLVYSYLGDSRIYRYRQGKLERLTQDHAHKDKKNGKNILTQALGTASQIHPEIYTVPIQKGDLYVVCSDGLSDSITDAQIEKTCAKSMSLKQTAFELVDLAKMGLGNDNITVLLIHII